MNNVFTSELNRLKFHKFLYIKNHNNKKCLKCLNLKKIFGRPFTKYNYFIEYLNTIFEKSHINKSELIQYLVEYKLYIMRYLNECFISDRTCILCNEETYNYHILSIVKYDVSIIHILERELNWIQTYILLFQK